MRLHRWSLVALVVALCVAAAAPVFAQDEPVVADRGQNLYLVDGSRGELYNTLPDEEVEKIKRLQDFSSMSVGLLSPVSPDDQAALAAQGESLGFLNIQDGAFLPFDPQQAFARFLPLALLGAGQFGWRDEYTLVSFGVEAVDGGDFRPALVTIDRLTAEVTGTQLEGFPEDRRLLTTSPLVNKVLLLAPPEGEQASERALLAQAPVTWPLPTDALARKLPPAVARWADARAQAPGLRTLLAALPLLNADRTKLTVTSDISRVQVYDTGTGELSDLKELPGGTSLFSAAWTSGGDRLALSSGGVYDYTTSPTGRERTFFDGALLSEQLYRDATGNLSPEENPFFQDNTLEVFDLNSGASSLVRAAAGDGAILIAQSWSSDGRTLMALAGHPGRLAGRRYPVYSPQFFQRLSSRFYDSELREVGRLDAPQLDAAQGEFVSPDELIYTAPVGSNIHPYYYNRVTGELRNLADRAGSYVSLVATRLSRQVVFRYSSFNETPELYRLGWNGAGLARLTWYNEELRQFNRTRHDPVSFRLRNGQVRQGTLIQPADATFPPKRVPLVVWQEGGPGGVMNNQWLPAIAESPYALLPNFGFALLVVPLSGRQGLGPQVYNALYDRNNFGAIDIDEQAEIVQQLIARGWVAQGKVGLVGCSYGGYFALQSLVRYPNLYAAANPQCALVDSINEWSRGYKALMPYIQGLPPYVALEEYRRDSPLFNADKIRAAVLTFHGTQDFLPVTLNENMHQQLANRNLPAKMFTFVDATHGLVANEYAQAYELFAAQEQITWFRTYLLK